MVNDLNRILSGKLKFLLVIPVTTILYPLHLCSLLTLTAKMNKVGII